VFGVVNREGAWVGLDADFAFVVAFAFLVVIPVGNLLPKAHHECYDSGMPRREYHFWGYILSSRSRISTSE
jgi:hypothetical protein